MWVNLLYHERDLISVEKKERDGEEYKQDENLQPKII